jgi:hypothetical protein
MFQFSFQALIELHVYDTITTTAVSVGYTEFDMDKGYVKRPQSIYIPIHLWI